MLADTEPVLIGRLNSPAYAGLHGLQTRYVADVLAVLSIVVALVFWSVADPRPDSDGTSRRRREFFTGRWRMIAIAITTVLVIGSVYSVQSFQTQTATWTVTSGPAYVANARAALADTPAGTVIVSEPVPGTLMKGTFGDAELHLLRAWAALGQGIADQLDHSAFGHDRGTESLWERWQIVAGRAARIEHSGRTRMAELPQYDHAAAGPALPACVGSFRQHAAHRLRSETQSAAGQVVQLNYGREAGQFTVQPGANHFYLAVHGSAATVALRSQGDFSGLCFGPAIAGYIVPFPGLPIPKIGS